jgi:glycosyltransferase involved in cell wall biosynthesis
MLSASRRPRLRRGTQPLSSNQAASPRLVAPARPRAILVGPGKRFLSGISYYTYGLGRALASERNLSVLLIRRLVPARLYPGGGRVGQQLSSISLPDDVPTYDGLDYFWGPSAIRTLLFLHRQQPDVLVLQWWTGTVLHSYLLLSFVARRLGAKVIVEFHESLDPGEQNHRFLAAYVRLVSPRLFRRCAAFVVHSDSDRELVRSGYNIDPALVKVIPHAVYDHHAVTGARAPRPDGICNLLFFGLIRPVKGLDDLIGAMDLMDDVEAGQYRLTIVGETWENCEPIVQMARESRHADRITIVNRYVSDEEADGYFLNTDLVVLPYRKSSQSGVLHLAMGYGLPVVATNVGGLAEAAADYEGGELVEPNSPSALLDGIRRARDLPAGTFSYGHRWTDTAKAYWALIDSLSGASENVDDDDDDSSPLLGRTA